MLSVQTGTSEEPWPRLVETTLDPAPPSRWFVYHRPPGRLRGRFEGPLDGPDAAIALLKDLIEIELLLEAGRTSSTYRIVRR